MKNFKKRILEVYNNENTDKILKERIFLWIEMLQIANGEIKDFPEMIGNTDVDESEMKEILMRAFAQGETVYCLGYMDGMRDYNAKTGIETLSLKDLTTLVKVYDSIKRLDAVIIEAFGLQRKESDLNGIPQKIVDIICNNICENMANRNEFTKKVICILCSKNKGAEKRAKMLLDLDFNIV